MRGVIRGFAQTRRSKSRHEGSAPAASAASRPWRFGGVGGAVSGPPGGESGLVMRTPRMAWCDVLHGSAGATLAPPPEMHPPHQGKPLLATRLPSPHFFGRRVARSTWQVWHDWQGTAVRGVSGGLGALLCLGSRGGLLGSIPSMGEVCGKSCLLVLSILRLLLDLRDAFVAMQSSVNCFDCRIAPLGWALWLAGVDSQQGRGGRTILPACFV